MQDTLVCDVEREETGKWRVEVDSDTARTGDEIGILLFDGADVALAHVPPAAARALAALLVKHADRAEGK